MTDTSERQERPLVSFIVACYDIPVDMLRECVDSILAVALSEGEREIVLVDDGSAVDYASLVRNYGDRIVYIRQANGGLSRARNVGIERATGEYVQFVDGDDRLLVDDYDACLRELRERRPDIVLFHLAESLKPRRAKPVAQYSAVDYLRRHNLRSSACGYVFRRAVLGDLRFTPGILHEDVEFTPLLFLRASTVVESGRTAYYYRQRESSITHNAVAERIKKRLDDVERILTRLKGHADLLGGAEKTAFGRSVAQYTMDHLYNIIRLSSFDELLQRTGRLRAKKLYPLPFKCYTLKYFLFAVMSGSRSGLRLMHKLWSEKR